MMELIFQMRKSVSAIHLLRKLVVPQIAFYLTGDSPERFQRTFTLQLGILQVTEPYLASASRLCLRFFRGTVQCMRKTGRACR